MDNFKSKYQNFGKLEVPMAKFLQPFIHILNHELTHSPPTRPGPVQALAKAAGEKI